MRYRRRNCVWRMSTKPFCAVLKWIFLPAYSHHQSLCGEPMCHRGGEVFLLLVSIFYLDTFQIFGPVCTLHPFSSEEEVIEWHNNVPYGLAGSVWTSNLRRAHIVSQRLETGMIWVNCWLRRYISCCPFQSFRIA